MDKQQFESLLDKKVIEIEDILNRHLPEPKGLQKTVFEAMEYSCLSGGKRLRPIILIESYKLFSGKSEIPYEVECFAAAIEFIHSYSLVHDDLPAMDNDEFRRGRLTTWKMYGDGMGVLAGDALLNYAFETAFGAAAGIDDALTLSRIVKAGAMLSEKSGSYGMIGGQCADLEAEGKGSDVTIGDLLFIHEHKTACLIEAALMVGGILGGADKDQIETLRKIGSNVGIAFQIRDDILDVIGNVEELGKKTGSDAQNDKVTYVTLKGIEESEAEAEMLSKEAEELLKSLPGDKDFLTMLIDSLIGRMR